MMIKCVSAFLAVLDRFRATGVSLTSILYILLRSKRESMARPNGGVAAAVRVRCQPIGTSFDIVGASGKDFQAELLNAVITM